jgi:hypothetical protein
LSGLNFFEKENEIKGSLSIFNLITALSFNLFKNQEFTKFLYFSELTQEFNDDSDKKKTIYPMYKLTNIFKHKVNATQNESFYNLISSHDMISNNSNLSNFFNINKTQTFKQFSTFSSNQSVLTSSKNIRNFINLNPSVGTINHNTKLNSTADYQQRMLFFNTSDDVFLYSLSTVK